MTGNGAFPAAALAAVLSATLALPCAEAIEVAVNYDKARKDRWRCRLCPCSSPRWGPPRCRARNMGAWVRL